jgi:hypothetical protein
MGTTHGSHIAVIAPTDVLTSSGVPANSYAKFLWTSSAAPHVAGEAALIQARAVSLFDSLYYGEDVCGLICASADTATSPAGQDYPNEYVGWGRINVAKALARLEEPYNFGEGPKLLATAGVDSYMLDTSLVFNDTTYFQYRCFKAARFDAHYDDRFAWGMDRYTTNGAPPFPGDTDEMEWKYCRVLPQSMSLFGCWLESFVFLKADSQATWIPCHPESLRWTYRVSGPHAAVWDGRDDSIVDVATGIYFCRIEAAEQVRTKKLVLLR